MVRPRFNISKLTKKKRQRSLKRVGGHKQVSITNRSKSKISISPGLNASAQYTSKQKKGLTPNVYAHHSPYDTTTTTTTTKPAGPAVASESFTAKT